MIDAAVIGLGRWGKNIVEAIQGKSRRLRIIRGVSKEPELVRDFAAAKGFELSTEFEAAVADPRVRAVFLATPHSLHVGQISAVAAAGTPFLNSSVPMRESTLSGVLTAGGIGACAAAMCGSASMA